MGLYILQYLVLLLWLASQFVQIHRTNSVVVVEGRSQRTNIQIIRCPDK